MFWQYLITYAHDLCLWTLISTIFDPTKGPKWVCVFTGIKGSSFGLYVEKMIDEIYLEISKRNPKNGLTRTFLILKGTKS